MTKSKIMVITPGEPAIELHRWLDNYQKKKQQQREAAKRYRQKKEKKNGKSNK